MESGVHIRANQVSDPAHLNISQPDGRTQTVANIILDKKKHSVFIPGDAPGDIGLTKGDSFMGEGS